MAAEGQAWKGRAHSNGAGGLGTIPTFTSSSLWALILGLEDCLLDEQLKVLL